MKTGLMILAFELFSKSYLNRLQMRASKRVLNESNRDGFERKTVRSIRIAAYRKSFSISNNRPSASPEPLRQETLIERDIDLFLFELHASGVI
jgi:hypothetical protein